MSSRGSGSPIHGVVGPHFIGEEIDEGGDEHLADLIVHDEDSDDGGGLDGEEPNTDVEKIIMEEEQLEDAENAKRSDGTRELNLTLWEAALWQQKVYAVFAPGSFPGDIPRAAQRITAMVTIIMFIVIITSTVIVLFESAPQYHEYAAPLIVLLIEDACIVIFTFEMGVRFVSCPSRLHYLIDPFNWVDLVSILPFYITSIGGVAFISELRAVRVLRLMRLLRVFRTRQLSQLSTVITAIQTSWDGLLLFLGLSTIALLVFSASMYYAERGTRDPTTGLWYRPCPFYMNCTTEITPFQSIPDAFWWAIAAISTVGFGDIVPVTPIGLMVGSFAMVSGVFILAVPTMILSGNFDAARKFGTSNAVDVLGSVTVLRHKKTLTDSPRSRLLRLLGWGPNDDPKRGSKVVGTPSSTQQRALDLTSGSHPRHGTAPRKKRHRGGPEAIGAFMYRNIMRSVYRDPTVNPHHYWYDPLLYVADCDDGGPSVRVIWASCGQPTMVRLAVVLDTLEARELAISVVEGYDPDGFVECSLGGGLEFRHWAPVATGSATCWKMEPCRVPGSFRNSDCPLYFRWALHEAELSSYTDDEIAELAVTALLGSSLHINLIVPQPPILYRLAIPEHVIHHTRLQRELELIAKAAERGGDLLAFANKDDVRALLHGVHTKLLVDTELLVENPDKLDEDIVDAMLSRVRMIRLHAVPKQLRKSSVYNGQMLTPLTFVYEFPMSLFKPIEGDDVKERALGYAEVKLRGYMTRTFRVDIRVDSAPLDEPVEPSKTANDTIHSEEL